MLSKPFRPPLRKEASLLVSDGDDIDTPLPKKRRLDDGTDEKGWPQLVFRTPGISSLPKKPLYTEVGSTKTNQAAKSDTDGSEAYYIALW